ncbi:MAG: outer membrane beta-barrel protein [Pseudomonadota bacterium]
MRVLITIASCLVALTLAAKNVQAQDGDGVWSPELYFSLGGGAVFMENESLNYPPALSPSQNYGLDTGFAVQGAVGATLPMSFRTELEVTYRENKIDNTFTSGGMTFDSRGDVSTITVMSNVLYDFPLAGPFSVFLGGGVGLAVVDLDFKRGPTAAGFILANGDDVRFAYQAIAGASFEIVEGVSIFGKYTYLGTTGDSITFSNTGVGRVNGSFDYHNHAVFGGLTFELGS